MVQATLQANQSRFGYHPCSHETYRKLKKLNKYYWETKRAFGRHQRWERKLPQNRVQYRWIKDEWGKKVHKEVLGALPEPKYCPHFRLIRSSKSTNYYKMFVYDHVLENLYRSARTPSPDPVESFSAEQLALIDGWLHRVEGWFTAT